MGGGAGGPRPRFFSRPLIRATYRLQTPPADAAARAEAVALESTAELPRRAVRAPEAVRLLGVVEAVEALGDGTSRAVIAYPEDAAAGDPAQLLNVLFGNVSLQPDVVLEDVALPEAVRAWLGGPRRGLEGWRAATGVRGRALSSTALKPMGTPPDRLAETAARFARAGLDVIKDDHGLADAPFCPFEARLTACLEAVDRVAQQTGHRALYVPNCLGDPETVRRQVARAQEAGAAAVMLTPFLLGLPAFRALVRACEVPVLAHPAWGGALRIAPEALLGTLLPAFGADAVVYPQHGGRFAYSEAACLDLARRARAQGALPVPAGGIDAARVPALLEAYGPDTMLLLGGSLYAAADPDAAARRFAERVRSTASRPTPA